MPQVGTWLAATWAAGGTGAALLQTAASITMSFAIAKINAPKGPRPQELQNEVRSSNAKRIRHLGRVRTSGTVVFWDWAHTANLPEVLGIGLNTRRLYKLLAVSTGGIEAVVQWYLDGAPVEVDADGYVTTAPWDRGNVRLQFRKGIVGDEWDGGDWPELRGAFPDAWTEDHRLRGIGTFLATFDAVEGEDIGQVYSGGEPEVSALIDGARAFWAVDGSAAPTRSPAVQLSDLLANPDYGPLTPADLDLPTFRTARDDGAAPVPTAGGSRSRYLSGISYALADPLRDTAQKVLDAMGGRAWITTEGKLAIEAGVWRPPAVTIEERHIVEMEYGAGTDQISRVTTLVPSYIAPQIHWQETTADPVEDPDAIARWGEGEPKGIDLLAVAHHGQAAHLCKQKLAVMNPRRRMSITLRAFGLRLIGEQKVAVNIPRLGLNATPFWIEALSFDGTNASVELIEANPAASAWTAGEEGNPPAAPAPIDRGANDLGTSITAVTVIADDGPPYIRIEGEITGQPGYRLLAQYRRSSDGGSGGGSAGSTAGSWSDMSSAAPTEGRYAFRTPPLADLADYDVRTFFGRYENGSGGRALRIASVPVVVTGIQVVANINPPADPVIVAASGTAGDSAGGTLSVTFRPDLGANYRRTGLYRAAAGGAFASASLVAWAYDTAAEVTMTAPIPGTGARFFLQSENPSLVPSGPVPIPVPS